MAPEIEVLIARLERVRLRATTLHLAIDALNRDSCARYLQSEQHWRHLREVARSSAAVMEQLKEAARRRIS